MQADSGSTLLSRLAGGSRENRAEWQHMANDPALARPDPVAASPSLSLSPAQARRIAVAAAGLAEPRPTGRVDRRHLRRVVGRLGLLQLDSVNVLARAHYLPLYSRLGGYPSALLDEAAWGPRRELFEYWGHEASLLPMASQPLLRWRMSRAAEHYDTWGRPARLARERPDYIRAVLAEVTARGPLRASDLEEEGVIRGGSWWGWRDAKVALEWLFWIGAVMTADRRGFERRYDLPERVLPAAVLRAPTPVPADAQRELVRIGARALGVATESDLRDYFRLPLTDARSRVAELVESGELLPVAVAGWRYPGYLWHEARIPARVAARALLSPFDPLVWERARTQRIFDFRYRIEIYVPAAQRVHGYYVLPFLLRDRLVARVDLKADRSAGALLVPAAYAQDSAAKGSAAKDTPEQLAAELADMAGWLGLDRVLVGARGDLAPALASAVSAGQEGPRSDGADRVRL